jgi:hypothetical protein
MIPMLRRWFTALRSWLGWNDPSDNHPHQAHGWLLPDGAAIQAHTGALAPVPVPVKPQPLGRKR